MTLQFFFHAMTQYANVMLKAQDELDKVVGRDRAPTFDDAASLPYIGAIVKEVLRWRPVTSLGKKLRCVVPKDILMRL